MSESLEGKVAVVTGASRGIGYELARQFAEHGFDLVVAADSPAIHEAAQGLRGTGDGANVQPVQADLSTPEGVQQLYHALGGRPVDALAANAGVGLGQGFFDQAWDDILEVINLNVVGTLRLVHLVGRDMRERGRGRILITGSIAGLMPGAFQAVYNGSKAFLDSFSHAIGNELKDSGVTVTCLMPGATDTNFFHRAGMDDTKIGSSPNKDDPADVAKTGFQAMMKGEGDVVHGLRNKLQAATAAVTPDSMLSEMHRKLAEPGTGQS
jgi:short-subunit dehydrogenase